MTTTGRGDASALAGFGLPVRSWFESSFDAPTPAQSLAWGAIRGGGHTLLVAPTGSGKTLAAFLSSLDRLAARTPAEVARARSGRKVGVIYISPLKALANDVQRNLTAPLRGIELAAQRLGQTPAPITVAIRSGDSPSSQRRRLVAHPPDILITTPESLFLLLSSAAHEIFDQTSLVIIDEIHALAGTKRGTHLQLSLERLADLCAQPIQRVGLSATVQPPERVARFLAGTEPVTILDPPTPKTWHLGVQVPVPDMTDLALPPTPDGSTQPNQSIWPFLEKRVLELVEGHRTTLCFVNSRRGAERLTAHLNEVHAERRGAEFDTEQHSPAQVMAQSGASQAFDADQWPIIARAHHGSVSKERRAEIEAELKSGRLPCVVATSSLELGIDMGSIDLVIQVAASPSVSSGLQRVGRAGHQVGAVSTGVTLPTHRGDLLEATVVTTEMLAGRIEPVHELHNPLDVLAQHLVSMVIDQPRTSAKLFVLVRRASSFERLTRPVFDGVLDMLSGRYPSEDFAELRPRVVWDRSTDLVTARPGARRLVTTSGGTIPDRGLYGVFLVGEPGSPGRRVGELDEEMVHESRVGDVFTLGTTSWRIDEITPHQVLVSPAAGRAGRLPFWKGDSASRPAGLGRAIGRLTRTLADGHQALEALAHLDANARQNLLAHVAEQRESTGTLPSDRAVVVERFRDELGDWRLVLHCPWGAAVLTPWALAIEATARQCYGDEVRAWASNDGIVISVPDLDEAPGLELVPTDAELVQGLVTDEVYGSALFAARFRECAARALLLPRRDPGRRTPLWRQRQRSAQLLQVASRHPDFPIILETMRECLEDVFDLPSLTELLAAIANRTMALVLAETERPSPFARSLLFGYVGEFLYDADQPLAERRLAALSVDQGLLAELLGRDGSQTLLDPAACELVEADLQRTAQAARATTAEALWDLVRMLGPVPTNQLGARVEASTDTLHDWVEGLVEQRRAVRTRLGGTEVLVVTDDLALLRDGLGIPLPPGFGEARTIAATHALDRLVLRQLKHRCGVIARQLATSWRVGEATIEQSLGRLRDEHGLMRADDQWWHPEVLARVRRRTLALLRADVEPVEPAQLARFTQQWHELDHPGDPLETLQACVELLAGAPVPASMLESVVLPARIRDYQPHLLDQLLAAGEVVWTGQGAIGSNDGWVQLWPADLLLARPLDDQPALDEDAAAMVARVGQSGAWTLTEIVHDLWGRTPNAGDVERWWQLVWRGHLSADSFVPVRQLLRQRRGSAAVRVPRQTRTQRRLLPRPQRLPLGQHLPGRWSRPRPSIPGGPARRLAEVSVALNRHGVLSRGSVAVEPALPPFSGVYGLLSAMEDQGGVRRGHFVEGLGAAQFAQPGVVDRLRASESVPEAAPVLLAACDPASPWGAALPWPPTQGHRPSRRAGALVVLEDGHPVLFVERGIKTLLTFPGRTEHQHRRALAVLAEAVTEGRLDDITIERVDGATVLGNPSWGPCLEAAGFSMTPRGFRRRRR